MPFVALELVKVCIRNRLPDTLKNGGVILRRGNGLAGPSARQNLPRMNMRTNGLVVALAIATRGCQSRASR